MSYRNNAVTCSDYDEISDFYVLKKIFKNQRFLKNQRFFWSIVPFLDRGGGTRTKKSVACGLTREQISEISKYYSATTFSIGRLLK